MKNSVFLGFKITLISLIIILVLLINNINLVSAANYYNNYSDVLLVCNNASSDSQAICDYFISKRVSKGFDRTHIVNLTGISTAETVDCSVYTSIMNQTNTTLQTIGVSEINYIVLTKGVPLRACSKSVDSMLAYAFGDNSHYFAKEDVFSHDKYGSYLVTRLDGPSVQDAKNLIDNSDLASLTGLILINKYSTSYSQDYGCTDAYNSLIASGKSAELNNSLFVTNRGNLSGYWSWGSNSGGNANSTAWNLSFNPGAIGDTAVSTSGRTLNVLWSDNQGQSLISDLIRMNITGVKGYVEEPYVSAVAKPEILFVRYADGYNLADSFYMASEKRNWMDVVIGDPKMYIVISSLKPSITLNSPVNGQRFVNGTILNLSIYLTKFANIASVWYNFNGTNLTLNSPYAINTSNWSYGNYNVTIYVNDTSGNLGFQDYSFIVNTTVGTLPTYNKFDGNTTNIKALPDWTNVSNLVLEQTAMGKIEFLANTNVSGADLDKYISFTSTGVSLNSSAIPGLNVSANISIYNPPVRSYKSFVILRDGVVCNSTTTPACYNLTALNSSTAVFNVTSFTSYEIFGDLVSGCVVLNQPNSVYTQYVNIIPTGIASGASCINITASNITFDCNGKWIRNTTADIIGIYAENVVNITIKNCNVTMTMNLNGGYGIWFSGVNNSVIENVTANSNAYGIYLYSSSNNTLRNITVNSNMGGIWITSNSNNNILRNITGDSNNHDNSGHAIYMYQSSWNSIDNVIAINSGYAGIEIQQSSNNNISNAHTIRTYSDNGGFYINTGSTNNTFTNISSDSDFTGIMIGGNNGNDNNNIFISGSIKNSTSVSYPAGIYFYGFPGRSASNNQFIDFTINNTGTYNIFLDASFYASAHNNNTFLNVSYIGTNQSELVTGGQLIRKWYYQAYVNDTAGNPAAGFNVLAYNRSGNLNLNLTTNTSGWTSADSLIEYVNNGTKIYYSNYTINASGNGIVLKTSSYNVSNELNNLNHALTVGYLTTCLDLNSSIAYKLSNNITNNGTCFTINADNVTLNLSGYYINSNNSGYGVYLNNKTSSSVFLGGIVNYLYKIYMSFSNLGYNYVYSNSNNYNLTLDGNGNTTVRVEMSNSSKIYYVKYDGILCSGSSNPNCTVNSNSNGIVNVSLRLD